MFFMPHRKGFLKDTGLLNCPLRDCFKDFHSNILTLTKVFCVPLKVSQWWLLDMLDGTCQMAAVHPPGFLPIVFI